MSTRRKFLKQATIGATMLATSQFPIDTFAEQRKAQWIKILHTNDVHSRLEPFPLDGGKYQGLGGIVAREKMISKIRNENEHVLLLDAGDIFQGTPYFNFFKGEPEIKAMNLLGYEAATLGNHDFDNGIDGLVRQMQFADFDFVNCNYDFSGTALETLVKPYVIIKKGKIKIGILGVGVELSGLVPDRLFGNIQYRDPITHANETAYFLKHQKKCDFVICLSHLGFEYKEQKVSDKILAKESENINLIIGGHTHTFLDKPYITKSRNKKEIIVTQVGWAGINLGEISVLFDKEKNNNFTFWSTAKKIKNTIE
ncbi:MAG: metallophosphoesterase [Chitinophagaceae bacterium]|nr:metallophosphoesterase [Chitinophagaceae bacterium]